MAYSSAVGGLLSDYAQLRTLPALTVSLLFVCSAILFGAIPEIPVNWLGVTITSGSALIVSLVIYVLAFASSETKSLEYYENWEMALISSGPGIMLAYQYIPLVQDQFAANSPTLSIIGFVFSLVSWGVMVR